MNMPEAFFNVPDEVKIRLRKNESAQRSRCKAKNKAIIKANNKVSDAHQISLIIIEKVDIIALYESQEWQCQCDRVPGHEPCFRYVDITQSGRHPDAPVLGHINNIDNGGNHVAENIGIMRHECNMKLAHKIEKTRSARTERLRRTHTGVKKDGGQYTKKRKVAIPARPEGLTGGSSFGKGRGFAKGPKKAWPKRKFGQ